MDDDRGKTHYYGDGCDPPHVMRDPVPDACTGAYDCPAEQHTHGCFRDDPCKHPEPTREPLSYTCPRCGRTSHHPDDVREGYCGACHDWTRDREESS